MSVFRKSSLDKLSSPEQLDKLIKMTSARSWMILAFFILIIASTLIWSFTADIPTEIQASGIIMSSKGTDSILSSLDGEISDVTIKKDDYVHVGDIIARISQSNYVDQETTVKEQIKVIQGYTLYGPNVQPQITQDVLDLYGIKTQIDDIDKQIQKMKLGDPHSPIAQSEAVFNGEVNYLIFQKNALEEKFNVTKSAKLDALSKQSSQLKNLIANSDIASTVEGKVLSVNVTKGNIVQRGVEIAKTQESGSDVNGTGVVFYVALEQGKKLLQGMQISVYPTTVNRQEYGHMQAVITNVSDYAVSVDDMRKKLGNDELINKFLQAGVVVEVDAIIQKDDSTKSGYYWSSKKGESLKVYDGTLCDASIIIEKNKPITLVFPLLKDKLSPFAQ